MKHQLIDRLRATNTPRHERGLAQPVGWASHEERFAGITSTGPAGTSIRQAAARAAQHLHQKQQHGLGSGFHLHQSGAGGTTMGYADTAGGAGTFMRYLGPLSGLFR